MMTMPMPPRPGKRPGKRPGRHRTSCAACRLARKKCEGGMPCDRCIETGGICVSMGLDGAHASKRPASVARTENGAAGLGEPPAAHFRHWPSTAAAWTEPPSSYVSDESLVFTSTTTYSYAVGGGKSSGIMATLGTGLSTAPLDISQGSESQPALPMICLERGQGDVSLSLGTAVTMGGYEEKVSPPPVPPAAGVYVAGGEEGAIHAVAGYAPAFKQKASQEGQSHEDWTSVSLEKSHIEVQEGHMDAGSGDVAEEAGDCGVVRPIGEIDNLAVAFEVACRCTVELSREGKLDINRASFVLKGIEIAFVVRGTGFFHPPYLQVLRQCISVGKRQRKAFSSARSASAPTSTAMSFLVHHAMAVADPHYTPPPCDPAYSFSPGDCKKAPTPIASFEKQGANAQSHGHNPQEQEQECVAGLNEIGPLTPHDRPCNSRRLGPGGVAPEVSWINELWSDPQAAACSFSIMEVESCQPIMVRRTNAYMAREFVTEAELALMFKQLKTTSPMLLARFMTRASTIMFYTLLNSNKCFENGERTCFVEMINRRGQLVGCLATIRWHHGPQHCILAARFTPLSSLNSLLAEPPTSALSPPLSPVLSSSFSLSTTDVLKRRVVSSVGTLPVSASLRPALSASLGGQASWPLLAPSAAPSPTRQAWQDLPTARLGGSGGEVERLPLRGLPLPLPPITSATLAAQTASPMVAGSAWPSWAAVAGEDAACSVGRVAASPVLCKEASDDTSLQPWARLPVPDVTSGVNLDDEEMQLLLEAIEGSTGGEVRPMWGAGEEVKHDPSL